LSLPPDPREHPGEIIRSLAQNVKQIWKSSIPTSKLPFPTKEGFDDGLVMVSQIYNEKLLLASIFLFTGLHVLIFGGSLGGDS